MILTYLCDAHLSMLSRPPILLKYHHQVNVHAHPDPRLERVLRDHERPCGPLPLDHVRLHLYPPKLRPATGPQRQYPDQAPYGPHGVFPPFQHHRPQQQEPRGHYHRQDLRRLSTLPHGHQVKVALHSRGPRHPLHRPGPTEPCRLPQK